MKTAKTKFEPFGPFTLPRANGDFDRAIEKKRRFWRKVEAEDGSLPDAIGCYIFALRAGKGYRPWYVGKTESANFKRETWEPSKLLIYGEVIRTHKGTPVLFLLAKRTATDRFKRPTKRKVASIAALEEMLIGVCLKLNRELVNKRATKFLKILQVPGFVNELPGARSRNAKALARLLNA